MKAIFVTFSREAITSLTMGIGSQNTNAIFITKLAAQGDVLFRRIKKLPDGLREVALPDGKAIVAHSETGHDHAIHNGEARLFEKLEADPMICYLAIAGECAEVVHHRDFDTHKTLALAGGFWEVRRQREWTPEGMRRVED